ncbi:MAG: hypothetical protein KC493_02850 [Bacteriovoracaceae bacterium]|nr:hypothetical protein [Bacteriovoracaceae bacterium]
MVAKRNFLIKSLIRVLTPEEISELTTTYCGERRVSLTSLLDQEFVGIEPEVGPKKDPEEVATQSKAKILPFGKAADDAVLGDSSKDSPALAKGYEFKVGPKVLVLFKKLYGISENSFNSMETDEVEVSMEKTKKGTSLFILDEKEKLDSSQKKLKSKEVLGTYKKVASMDIETEKSHKDDLSWSSCSGLLINKKQY